MLQYRARGKGSRAQLQAKEPPQTGAQEPPQTGAQEPPQTGAQEPPQTEAQEPPQTEAQEPRGECSERQQPLRQASRIVSG
jgi:hypothetical protein